MKIFILLLAVSINSYAQDKGNLTQLIRVLENPAKVLNEPCAEVPNAATPWCQNLSASSCAVKKTNDQLATVDQDLFDRFAPPDSAADAVKVAAQMRIIAASEAELEARTKISNADLVKLIGEVRTSMMRMLTTSNIPAKTQEQMRQTLSSITFRSGIQYIEKSKQTFKAANPEMSDIDLQVNAMSEWVEFCGETGMNENAFYSYEHESMVLCPGLIQSVSEYGRSKQEVLNGLSFTIGHEIAHSVDSNEQPKIYDKMRDCHIANAGVPNFPWDDQEGEVTADFWGAQVLGERLTAQGITGQDAVANIALAMDGLCDDAADEHHPSGVFRIDNILSRDPQLRNTLSCEAPTADKPFCSLEGAQPAPVQK